MSDYDYAKLEAKAKAEVKLLEGRLLEKVLVHVVEPEFNLVIFVTDAGTWEVFGRVGSEVVGIRRAPAQPTEYGGEHERLGPYPPFSEFEGRRIAQARTIGEAWNGHGFEFTFDGLPNRTMLIQSIYSSPKSPELHDCLRLGIGTYASSTEEAG